MAESKLAPELMKTIQGQLDGIVEHSDREFKVVLIKHHQFYDYPGCPHCHSLDVPKFAADFNEDEGDCVGEIAICLSCEGIVIPLIFPILAYAQPIFLNWKLKP